jgi:F-type H+-transporting ATPase subunit gamma
MRAMRALAASHVQEAQDSLTGIRRYVEIMEESIAEVVGLLPGTESGPYPPSSSPESALIVVCSEHGFTGAFNDALLDSAAKKQTAGQQLGIIGLRGAMKADERKLDVAWNFPMATHVGGVLGVTRRVADHLANAATAEIIFGRYKMGGAYEVQSRAILPLDPNLLAEKEHSSRPLHHLKPDKLLQQVANEYLFAEITRAVMESLASENGARLQLLSAADSNIGDKLAVFRRQENSLRQEAITSELLDVVTGAEAIMSEPSA